ncbi:HD domain-containing phosphohydrolase [Lujinxingia sediminis]|nr:HD domain-containing phosphohydrolase [Lujinxingia sediminis]
MQPVTDAMNPHILSLTVLSGPDAGLTRSFQQERVQLGRDRRNDFVLSDGFVSNRHGEFSLEGSTLVYRDLCSRHGSTVMIEQVSMRLHDKDKETQVRLQNGAEVQLGSSLIRVDLARAPGGAQDDTGLHPEPELTEAASASGERFITTAHQPVQTIHRRLQSSDQRMAVLFRLAGQLNGLTALDEVLNLIVDAVFDAFPAANFFAVTLASDPETVVETAPMMTRVRGDKPLPGDEEAPILSSSILKRVAQTRESVLFVKDSLGADISQSIIDAQITACLCAPLVGQQSLLGVMQVDTRGRGSLFSKHDLELFNILASNAAFAIERARLTESIVEMFEGFVAASVDAIEARDPITAGHSERVASYTLALAETVNEIETGRLGEIHFQHGELTELRYAALLHDFGKIAVSESVLQKGARLPPEQMRLIGQRFATVRELAYRQWLRAYAEELERGDARPDGRGLARIDGRFEAFSAELEETFEWLGYVATKGFVEKEEIARVREVAARTYVDHHGRVQPYLTTFEAENLCIQRGTLNEAEWVEMRSHAALSEKYLSRIPWSSELSRVPCIAGAHHEKLDGTGYPRGLGAEKILPQVRMLTIADIFDALTASDRPYRKAATVERALQILGMEAGDEKLDRDLVDLFGARVIPRISHIIPGGGRS